MHVATDREREMTVLVPKEVRLGVCANCGARKRGEVPFMRLWVGPGKKMEYCPECFGLFVSPAMGKC